MASQSRCDRCRGETVVRPTPEGVPVDDITTIVRVCERCLSVTPAPGEAVDRDWDPLEVSPALPGDPDAAVRMAVLVTLLDSLALNRQAIERTVAELDAAGVDPLLALERIDADEHLDPFVDLPHRRVQLAQLLDG